MRGDALWAAVLEAYAATLVRRHAWLEARERERERERENGSRHVPVLARAHLCVRACARMCTMCVCIRACSACVRD